MSHDNPEIGEFLDLLGNNTRRRILESLTNEPKYFIQLSKEIGVSQQAVLKHLFLLENFGLIESFKAKSNLAAPDRKYFQLNRSVYLSIGITGNSMEIKMENIKGPNKIRSKNNMAIESKEVSIKKDKEITDILKNTKHKLELLAKRMQELEDEKIHLLKEKQQILEITHQVIRESLEEDLARRILYSNLISREIIDIEELSEILNTREKEIKIVVKSLEDRFSVDLI
ncbi:MAG: ArsR family transcriptional regulator [Thaumarchaeota archaeon]|nr:ArsR family transcriptional regulator [Nitrososphaerota archaeon]|tara:strand:- start:45 stop:728 length:684 start_codon:yes stop_codon:yes gene_type:complete